ncbi:MAG: hypothetical protein MUF15_15340 [Acidobacteria bacterium]|jgi:hypothetical protein|nr:hypothetical protein [Acidobacteriota bacterium]
MALKLKQYVPLIISIALLWLILIVLLNNSLVKTQGNLVYILDDAYIHMAMAKNFSQNGTWGVTYHGFSSTSSSPLWTLLLSGCYYIFGVNEKIPFMLNFFFATMFLFVIFYVLRQFKFSPWLQMLIPAAFILFIPLSYLVFCGLEHVLQILISLVYIYTVTRIIAEDSSANEKTAKTMRNFLFFMAPLVTMVRYEGLFILLAVSFLLLTRRKWVFFIINIIAGLMPIMFYGFISIAKGWYFLPNSVLIKGTRLDITRIEKIFAFFYAGLRQVIYNIHLLVLLIVILALLWLLIRKYDRFWLPGNSLAVVFIITLACQAFFSESGYFLNRYPWIRYDSYLAAIGILTILFQLGYLMTFSEDKKSNRKLEKILGVILVSVLILPLAERGIRTDFRIPQASANIYNQQYQMGLFLKKYYRGQAVAINDIGAACFLGDIQCLDVWGLANKDVGQLILNKSYTAEKLDYVVKKSGARIAVVYDQFFRLVGIDDDLPGDWLKVGEWRTPNNIVCVRDTVCFYALDEAEMNRLNENLKKVMCELPPDVIKAGAFIKK